MGLAQGWADFAVLAQGTRLGIQLSLGGIRDLCEVVASGIVRWSQKPHPDLLKDPDEDVRGLETIWTLLLAPSVDLF